MFTKFVNMKLNVKKFLEISNMQDENWMNAVCLTNLKECNFHKFTH